MIKSYKNMKFSINIIYLIVGILSVLLIVNSFVFAKVEGKVNTSNIRVRKEANTSSEVLTNLYTSDFVYVLGKTGDWYKIETEDKKIGYIKAEFVDTNSEKVENLNETTTSNTNKTASESSESKKVETTTTEEKTNSETTNKTETKEDDVTKKETVVVKKTTNLKLIPVIFSLDKVEVKEGEELKKLEVRNNWIKVEKDSKEYWILKSLVK